MAQAFPQCYFFAAGVGGPIEKPPYKRYPQAADEADGYHQVNSQADKGPTEYLPHPSGDIGRAGKTARGAPDNRTQYAAAVQRKTRQQVEYAQVHINDSHIA